MNSCFKLLLYILCTKQALCVCGDVCYRNFDRLICLYKGVGLRLLRAAEVLAFPCQL